MVDTLDQFVGRGGTVVDLGAGVGVYVQAFADHGYRSLGFDGIEGIEEQSEGRVMRMDLSRPGAFDRLYRGAYTARRPDAAITIEVGEHIPPEHSGAFLDNLCDAAKTLLIVSWAVPGQRGRNHVSCRLPEWVSCEIGQRGWSLEGDATSAARATAGKGWDRKLMVFLRETTDGKTGFDRGNQA